MLVKGDNLPRMSWRKGRIINVIRGADKLIRGAEIKKRQRNSYKMLTLKQSLKYLVPFEVMDPDKGVTEKNDVIVDDLLRRLNDNDSDIDE